MSDETPKTDPWYDGGMISILDRAERRRTRLSFADGEALPGVQVDLAPFVNGVVGRPSGEANSGHSKKKQELQTELAGKPRICLLHGLVVAHLRKRRFPRHAPDLFQRLWAEQSDVLLQNLDLRWQVSAATTFGDHGATPVQRSVGMGLTMLFGMMKLYETERLFSGLPADQPFPMQGRVPSELPMTMDGFSIARGDLDYNLLARLWREAADDPVIFPLTANLLNHLVADPRGVFRRISLMRGQMGTTRTNAQKSAE